MRSLADEPPNPEISAVLKPTLGCLFALSVAMTMVGCQKEPAATATVPSGHPATDTQSSGPHPSPSAPAQAVDLAGIAKAEGGRTIAEVFAEKDQLAGQMVVIRGKVVKTNPRIMGKNWLHVRDGSGAEGSNDLTVTTVGTTPMVGDTVVVSGPVVLNKDFGMGYTYDVIIEDAEVTVESSGS
jgi:hypothetical protein